MKADLDYIEIAISAIQDALSYVSGDLSALTEAVFLDNKMMRNAMLMHLIVVGETLGKVSAETQTHHPSPIWKQAKFARNFYIHQYDGIEWPTVYETVTTDLKHALALLKTVRQNLQNTENNATNQ